MKGRDCHAFPPEFLREVGERNRIEDVAASYVNLRRRGKNLVGLCPFHNEKTPSFCVYPENNSFFCFGCNKGGDVITFIMGVENLDFSEAVRLLAQRRVWRCPRTAPTCPCPGARADLEINREFWTVFLSGFVHAGGQGRAGLFPAPGPGRKDHPAFWPGLFAGKRLRLD